MSTGSTRTSQRWAGGLIIASALITFTLPAAFPARPLIAGLAAVGGLLLIAYRSPCFRGDALGRIVLTALSAWLVINGTLLQRGASGLTAFVPGAVVDLVGIALGAVAAVQVVRQKNNDSAWRWGPAVAVAVYALAWIVSQLAVGADIPSTPAQANVLAVCSLLIAASSVFVGVLAICQPDAAGRDTKTVSAESRSEVFAPAPSAGEAS